MQDKDFLERINYLTEVAFDKSEELLLREAFTHPSLKGQKNYERLEFLGDRVLAITMAHWLHEYYPHYQEGDLSVASARLVSKPTLLLVAKKLQFEHLLITGIGKDGTKRLDVRAMDSAMANSLESFLAVLFLTKGLEAVQSFVKKHWQDFFSQPDDGLDNPRGQLQEWLQARKLPAPIYEVVGTDGHDHEPIFTVELNMGMEAVGLVRASATSKKLAMSKAAAEAIAKIKKLRL